MAFLGNENNKILQHDENFAKIDPESATIAGILSENLYKDVANILGLDEKVKEKLSTVKRKDYKQLYKGVRFLSKAIKAVTWEKNTNEEEYRTSESIKDTLKKDVKKKKPDNYKQFLKKRIRDKVTWPSEYLPPETEKEKGLVKRAEEVTDKICKEFSEYMKSLGGYDSSLFDIETLKELFQIEFDTHAARSLQIHIKPLPTVPIQIADHANAPNLSFQNTLNAYINRNVNAEKGISKKHGFGRCLPKENQLSIFNYNTKMNWKQTPSVPETVETMKGVFENITQLKSVQDYCKWVINNPNAHKPAYLKRSKLLNPKFLDGISKIHRFNEENNVKSVNITKESNFPEQKSDEAFPGNMKIYLQ